MDLPSWNDGDARRSILAFVERTQDLPTSDRIAVFDNDGTLWSERPAYFQILFALDRVKQMAPEHPEWAGHEFVQAAADGDIEALVAGGKRALLDVLKVTHAGMTTDEFEGTVLDWISSARHSETGRPYTEMVFQPMLELLDFLRANGFRTYIVSGGGIEFMRPWAERVYGIPPEQVIGSSVLVEYELRESGPVLSRLPEIDFIDDKEGKPVGIHRFIYRRPRLAFGNSDGDHQMLQWTAAGDGPRFMGLVHHTDDEREWAYDRGAHMGGLDAALDEARERGWTVVDMKRDWSAIYPEAEKEAV